MKKIKVVVSFILRCLILFFPGFAFAWWVWGKTMALIAILASVGTEAIYLLLFSLFAVAMSVKRSHPKTNEDAEPIV